MRDPVPASSFGMARRIPSLSYSNQVEAIMQWGNVLGLSTNPTTTTTVIIPNITNQWTHQVWKDTNGATLLDAWTEINGPHGTDANLDAQIRHSLPGPR